MSDSVKTTYDKASRTNWSTDVTEDQPFPGREVVKLGCLQRIANATEAMASNFIRLQQELQSMTEKRDMWRKWYEEEKRKVIAYKGTVTRFKNKSKK